MPGNSWNFMDPASQTACSRSSGAMRTTSSHWSPILVVGSAGTACEGWEVRDVVGHMIDATEGYFPGWEAADTGATTPEPVGLTVMASTLRRERQGVSGLSQDEAIARLRA